MKALLTVCWVLLASISNLNADDQSGWSHQWLVGYGESIPGWGITEERVRTADIVSRVKRQIRTYEPGQKLFGVRSYEVWIETTFHALISDSDPVDDDDYGILDLGFMGAFTFEPFSWGEPFVMVGGGPAYLFADIRGAGMDFTANYQAGFGVRGKRSNRQSWEILMKYHHISNMSLADPNISMNSLRFQFSLPF